MTDGSFNDKEMGIVKYSTTTTGDKSPNTLCNSYRVVSRRDIVIVKDLKHEWICLWVNECSQKHSKCHIGTTRVKLCKG